MALERVPRDVKPERRLLGSEHFNRCPAFNGWRDLAGKVDLLRHRAEQSTLTDRPLALRSLSTRQRRIDTTKERPTPILHRAPILERVKRAGTNQALEDALVQSR